MSNVTIVLLYAALLVVLTSIISFRTKDPDPMLAGRNMPWWLISGSIVGTYISSIAFLAVPSKGIELDFNFIAGRICETFFAAPIAVLFFVSFLRQTRDASIYTLLGDRFGHWASMYASIVFIVRCIVRTGIISCLVGYAVNAITGADVSSIILLTGAIVIFYTYMSGIEGVIWTDFFQSIILFIASGASIVFLWQIMPDASIDLTAIFSGLSEASSGMPAFVRGRPILFSWRESLLCGLFLVISNVSFYASNQGLAQRYIVARTSGHAKGGLLVANFIIPFATMLFFGCGILLFLYYTSNAGSESLVENQAQNLFATFIAQHFPNGLKGLVVIGILAASMSTIDTGINSSSTVFICNLYEPYAKASTLKKALLTTQVLRNASLAFGVVGILAAYWVYQSGEHAFDFFWKAISIIDPTIFGLFLLLRMNRRAGRKAGIYAAIVGTLVAIWMTITAGWDHFLASPFHYMWAMPASVLATLIVGWLASLLLKEDSRLSLNEQRCPTSIQRSEFTQKRKRAKKNILAAAIRPNPCYRIYTTISMAAAVILYISGSHFDLVKMDFHLLIGAIISLLLVTIIPFFINSLSCIR